MPAQVVSLLAFLARRWGSSPGGPRLRSDRGGALRRGRRRSAALRNHRVVERPHAVELSSCGQEMADVASAV